MRLPFLIALFWLPVRVAHFFGEHMYLKYFQILVTLIVILGIITQVAIPTLKGTKIFPMFSKRRKTLDENLVDTREALELKTQEGKLNQLKSLLNQEESKS